MSEDLDLVALLAGLGQPRPMEPEMRARLERTLLAPDALTRSLVASDGPRPLPEAAKARLGTGLLGAEPMAMPRGVRRRLVRRLGTDRRVPAMAAAVTLLVMVAAVALTVPDRHPSDQVGAARPSPKAAIRDQTGGAFAASGVAGGKAAAGSGDSNSGAGAGALRSAGPAAASSFTRPWPRPPFTDDYGVSSDNAVAGGGTASSVPPPKGAPVRVGVYLGDADQETAFRAYIKLANDAGGANGHRIDLVEVGPTKSSTGTIATVNLSRASFVEPGAVPAWTAPVVLETLTVPEASLRGDVFSMASPIERQGRIAVNAAFPIVAPSATAVVYHSARGTYADRVAPVVRAQLQEKGVTVIDVAYDPRAGVPLVTADAAFAILDIEEVHRLLAQARASGYSPPRRIWALAAAADEGFLADMPAATSVISPYDFLTGPEADTLRSQVGALSARRIHGWETAKWLAYAIWRGDATTPSQLSWGLSSTSGWSSGWAPPYQTRPRSRARTPEGLIVEPGNRRLVRRGEFLRDG